MDIPFVRPLTGRDNPSPPHKQRITKPVDLDSREQPCYAGPWRI